MERLNKELFKELISGVEEFYEVDVDCEEEVFDTYAGYGIKTIENISKLPIEIGNLEDEISILYNLELFKASLHWRGNELYSSDSIITRGLNKKFGNLYWLLDGKYKINNKRIRKLLNEELIRKYGTGRVVVLGQEYHEILMPSGVTLWSNGWSCGNEEWFNNIKNSFRKSALKEVAQEYKSLRREPVLPEEEKEGEESFGELSREYEMLEFLQILLQLKSSGRKLNPEEIELLREIISEAESLI